MDIVRGFATLPKISLPVGGRDDDVFADRLNYKYTTFILIISSFTITYKILQYDHIQCWVPAILARYEHYINIYCWISNTYFVTYKEQTTSLNNKQERMVKYYQWVPLILLGLAFSFLLPRFFYRFLSKQSGIDMLNIADAAVNYASVDKFDKRRKILTYLTNTFHFYATCNRYKRIRKGFTNMNGTSGTVSNTSTKPHLYDIVCCYGGIHGSYLVVLYMIIKIFYISNTIVHLFLLNILLGFNYNSEGLTLLKSITTTLMGSNDQIPTAKNNNAFTNDKNILNINPKQQPIILSGHEIGVSNLYQESVYPLPLDSKQSDGLVSSSLIHRYFPRESACDFRIRMNVDSMVHNYTVQCVLPINLFNEQLFTLLWTWLWVVCIVNCYDLLSWIVRLFPGSRYRYIRDRLRLKHSENTVKRAVNSFVFDYLASDGVFLLRILTLNTSDSVTHDVVQFLWHNYSDGNRAIRGTSESGMQNDNRSKNYSNPNVRLTQRFNAQSHSKDHNDGANAVGGDGQEQRYTSGYVSAEVL